MTTREKIQALVLSGLADDEQDARVQLIDMGELEDDSDHTPIWVEMERNEQSQREDDLERELEWDDYREREFVAMQGPVRD